MLCPMTHDLLLFFYMSDLPGNWLASLWLSWLRLSSSHHSRCFQAVSPNLFLPGYRPISFLLAKKSDTYPQCTEELFHNIGEWKSLPLPKNKRFLDVLFS